MAELAAGPTITLKQVAERIGKSSSTMERTVAVLVKDGRLRFVGPRKSGLGRYWIRMCNHLAPQLTDSGLPRHRQVLPTGGVTGAQVLLSHHPLRRPRVLAGKAYAPQSLGFDLVHHGHQRI